MTLALGACGTAHPAVTTQASEQTLGKDLAPAVRLFDTDGPVNSLAYDAKTKTVWLTRNIGSGATLDNVTSSGRVTETKLPGGPLGGQSKVKVSPDGSIWVTDDYRLLRFDPAQGAVDSKALDLKVDGQLPEAEDLSSPSPGTWVSALTFDRAGNAIMARHNVASLFVVTPKLTDTAVIPIDKNAAGAGELLLDASGLHGLSGRFGAGDQSITLAPLMAFPAGAANQYNVMQASSGDSTQVFAQGPDGLSAIVKATPEVASVTWGPKNQQRGYTLPRFTVEKLAPDGESVVSLATWTHPTVLLPTPDGALWFAADVNGHALFRLQ